jgi:RimJ/RimL family protein N-acetyltransferase
MVTIRRAKPSDARALVAHIRAIVSEPIATTPLAIDEVPDAEDEHDLIEDYAEQPRALLLVAEQDGVLVGDLSLRAISARRSVCHVATLGMSVAAAARRRGIGRALLTEALAWAPTVGITRVELYVYARNAPAIALYEACGFAHEGRRRSFIREGDGYLDDLIMARLL